jgi:hypothetical protein
MEGAADLVVTCMRSLESKEVHQFPASMLLTTKIVNIYQELFRREMVK